MISDGAIRSLDTSGLIDRYEAVYPHFFQSLAAIFRKIWDGGDSHLERAKERAQDFCDRGGKFYLSAEYFGWEKEVFLCSILNVVDEEIDNDQLSVDSDRVDLLQPLMPAIEPFLAAEMSLTVRPNLPKPRETVEGDFALSVIGTSGVLSNWSRIGSWERQIDRQGDSDGEGCFQTAISAAFLDQRLILPGNRAVAAFGETNQYLKLADLIVDVTFPDQYPRSILTAWKSQCLLGTQFMLLPHSKVIQECSLRLSSQPGPIAFVNKDGESRIEFRTWRTNAHQVGHEGCRYDLQGCDLIAHPEVVDSLSTFAPLRYATKVFE